MTPLKSCVTQPQTMHWNFFVQWSSVCGGGWGDLGEYSAYGR